MTGRDQTRRAIPVALTIAGSDSSAGAGLQADLKTFAALDVFGVNAVTCVVAETPGKVAQIEEVTAAMVAAQIRVLFESFPIAAMKTGMLHSAEIVETVAHELSGRVRSTPLVIDPVMVATSGDSLLRAEAVGLYRSALFPLATLITPNLDEAAHLLGEPIPDLAAMRKAGPALARRFGVPILLKGGHLQGDEAIDLLCQGDTVAEFSAPFRRGVVTHGTGCTYSAAITAGLARGLALNEAVGRAKQFVSATIAQHLAWPQASGNPLHALNHSPNE